MPTHDLSSSQSLASIPPLGTAVTLAGLILVMLPLTMSETSRPALISPVRDPECYALAYSDPIADATADMFPRAVALFPGSDSGAVASRGSSADRIGFWRMFLHGASWRSVAPDSVDLSFSNGFSSIRMRVQRTPTELSGRATYYSDVITEGPKPSLAVVGERRRCSSVMPTRESPQPTRARTASLGSGTSDLFPRSWTQASDG